MTFAEALYIQEQEEIKRQIEQDFDQLHDIQFFTKTFNQGRIGKNEGKFLDIARRIIDSVKRFQFLDQQFYVSTLARLVSISKDLSVCYR